MDHTNWRRLLRQTFHLTWASLKSRYRKTVAGFVWVLLNPLIMFGVQSLVFKKFLRLEIPNFYVFLLSGLLPWIFMTQTIQMGTPTLISNSGLLKSFKFHPGVLVTSVALDNFINFILAMLFIAVPALVLSELPLTGLVYGLVCLVPFLLGTISLTLLTSLMNVFYRDLGFVLNFLFSIFFFITPIFYPVDLIPEHLQWLVDFNPFYQLLRPFRMAIYQELPFDWVVPWCISVAWAIGITFISTIYWRKKRNALYIQL